MLKFNKFLVEEGGNDILVDVTHNFMHAFFDTVCDRHGSNRCKDVVNIISGGISKVPDPNQVKWLSRGILAGLAWVFFTLLAVYTALLQYSFPHGPTWFNIHDYCNSLKFVFTITAFSLAVHVLDKSGRGFFF